MIERTYLGTECWSCGMRFDNTGLWWPYCINCGSPAWESLNNGQRQHLQDVLDKQKQVYGTARDELEASQQRVAAAVLRAEYAEDVQGRMNIVLAASQQRVAELEAALENIGNMAYTALHMNGDIRDRNLAELEHACTMILAEVREFDDDDSPTKEETR